MKPIYIFGGVLFAALFALAAAGVLLVRIKRVRSRHIANYTRLSTVLILAATYAMAQGSWPGVHMRPLDMWSLLVILAILCYSVLHAVLTHALPHDHEEDFSKSYMLSMLYTDSEHMADADLKKAMEAKSAKPDGVP